MHTNDNNSIRYIPRIITYLRKNELKLTLNPQD